MRNSDEYAESAYAAYGDIVDWKNFRGEPMPDFDSLPEIIQQAWAAACEATIDRYLEQDFPEEARTFVRIHNSKRTQ